MIPYKNRQIDDNKPVQVHRNLHMGKLNYSIKQNNLVVGHSNYLALTHCRFLVNKSGQAYVRRTKQKMVHAFVEGYLLPNCGGISPESEETMPALVSYNPYTDEGFMVRNITQKPFEVKGARFVIINSHGVSAVYTY